MSHRWTYERAKKFIEDAGYSMVSDEFHTTKDKIWIHCDKHGDKEVKFANFIQSRRCPECSKEHMTSKRKTIDDARALAHRIGCELVSTVYHDVKGELIARCPKHGEFPTTYLKMYVGTMCPQCSYEKKFVDFSTVKDKINKAGYECLDDHYVDENTPIKMKCPIHGNFSQTYARLNQCRGCQKCGHEHQGLSIRGERNKRWGGGRSATVETLRNVLWPWINEQLKKANYTCEITGEKSKKLNVHHMTKFTHIVDVTMDELGIKFKPEVKDYTDEEWRLITRKLDENNRKMANPIVMLDSVHRRFHQFCGGCSAPTSYEQLEQFKKMLKEEQEKKAG